MSNPHNIIRTSDFDPAKISFGEAKNTDYGGKQVRLSYTTASGKTVNNVTFQTPKMRSPFGAFSSQMSEGDAIKYYLELSFGGESPLVEKAHTKFQKLDELLLEAGIKNSQKWFGKKTLSKELAEDKYSGCIRRYKDPETKEYTGKYPDTFRVKIPKSPDGRPYVEVYGIDGERVHVESMEELLEYVPKGSYVKAIVQATNVWVTQKYGMGWRLVQLKVYPSGQINTYSFRDDEDEEDLD